MKTKIYILITLIAVTFNASSQFVLKPLNYQVSGDYYLPYFYSIVDVDRVWIGTKHYLGTGQFNSYSYAVHSNDGGDTWIFDSIPAPGPANISNVSALDENICFYALIENNMNGSVWKTTDGGSTWTRKTTTQFLGGFLNFYHAFNANEGLAMGDPNGGYFEIYRTIDGGDTWARIDSANIPVNLTGEMGLTDAYATYGDNIWFGSSKGRCYKSTDQGQHWAVSTVVPGASYGEFDVAFSSSQNGVFFDYGHNASTHFFKTSDGGTTWIADSIQEPYIIGHMSSVGGFDGGFVISAYDPITYLASVFFTPDFFSSIVVLDSNLMSSPMGLSFSDATTGWLCGSGYDTNDIYKFTGLLTSVFEATKSPEKLSIMPNPTANEALVNLPASFAFRPLEIRIIDLAGREYGRRSIASSTGWTKLNAAGYSNGNYIVEILSGNQIIACEKWVVNH